MVKVASFQNYILIICLQGVFLNVSCKNIAM